MILARFEIKDYDVACQFFLNKLMVTATGMKVNGKLRNDPK
jgi:hypothetical protein